MSPNPRVPLARTPCLTALLALSGCATYEPMPFDAAELVARIDAERHEDTLAGEPVTLATAAEWLRAHGPAVQEAIAEWRTAQALADVDTPWPNPSVAAGPVYGFGDEPGLPATAWFASLGVPIPLGGRLDALDDLHVARAQATRLGAELELRQRYLELRGAFASFALARARSALLAETAELARLAADVGRQLAEAGRIGALDVSLLELEAARRATDRLDAELGVIDARATLAVLCGVAGERFDSIPEDALPSVDIDPPVHAELRALLIEHGADLLLLRSEYASAEAALRLEVERQYPDLDIETMFDEEPGEDRSILGLSIGLQLPVFDRNQQAIARASAHRDAVRERYVAAARRSLAELEHQSRSAAVARERREMLEATVVPRARENVDLAERTLAAGEGDALKLLEVQRSARDVELQLLDARAAEIRAWTDLELALGHPLLTFPGENAAPPELAAPTRPEDSR